MMKPYHKNPRQITKKKFERLNDTLVRLGDLGGIVHNLETDEIIGGNQRMQVFQDGKVEITNRVPEPDDQGTIAHGFIVWKDHRFAYRQVRWDEKTAAEANIAANIGAGDWDWDVIANEWAFPDLVAWGMSDDILRDWKRDVTALDAMLKSEQGEPVDAEPQINRAEELQKKWQVKTGDLWIIGDHRLLCGDSTNKDDVLRVMGGEKANLLMADPPYGMGKENEGIENDNLYRAKLDIFQMAWWKSCRPSLTDNASVYIWGTAEDLWRLWYCGGLKDGERLTIRNEIVWDKESGQGMGTSDYRMYALASERCLFFVIGEQGWNNNADNYFDGWEPIRLYLEQERKKAGWDIPAMKRAVGHSDLSGDHWTSKSQWTFPSEDVYKKLQIAANGDAFKREYDDLKREYDDLKREYDDLKREFYLTRAPFNNTHELMTDVWRFATMRGNERPDHPTPKPPEMIARIIKTSGVEYIPVFDPFAGSGTTGIACQNLGRKARMIEISPAYAAVILQRFTDAFPDIKIELTETESLT